MIEYGLDSASDADYRQRALELLTPPHHLFLNSAFNEIPEIREEAGPARVLVHPDDAGDRHISNDDPVRVFNDRGECFLYARVTTDTQPGLLVAAAAALTARRARRPVQAEQVAAFLTAIVGK